MRIDYGSLRRAIQDHPLGERIVQIAVEAALAQLQGDAHEAGQCALQFTPESAASLETSLRRYFSTTSYPEGTERQTIMDSEPFRRWQSEWLPTFVRTVNEIKERQSEDAQLLNWLRGASIGNRP